MPGAANPGSVNTSPTGDNGSTWLERVFVEQDGKVIAISVSVDLTRNVGDVVGGFLENHSLEAATGCGEDLCGSPVSWAWVPLEHGGAVLVVHEITDRVGE